MANVIAYDARPDLGHLRMSNGLTSVFISVLALAASALAASDREREFAVWVASHDQGVFGAGTVGFDVSLLPWSHGTLAADRAFMLRSIAAARARTGWERLSYNPRDDWVRSNLDKFHILMKNFAMQHACGDDGQVWSCGRPDGWRLCPIHHVLLHAQGCVLCNDR